MGVFIAVAAALAVWLETWWISLFAVPFLAGAAFILYFFRDPDRTPPEGDELVLSPADGVVTHVMDVENAPYIDGPAKKVSIFMSLLNVHVNRAPLSGKVEFIKHKDGKFFNAMDERSLEDNESNSVGFSNGHGKFLVKQIAGVIARRIVCTAAEGGELVRGERFGMVKFGSRLEVFVPAGLDCEFKVSKGDKVTAGETVIGRINGKKDS